MPDLERWEQIGEFEVSCPECGDLIEPVVFLVNEPRKTEYVHRGSHSCERLTYEEQRSRRKERAAAVIMARMDKPTHQEILRIAKEAHLPSSFHPGLHVLTRDRANESAIQAATGLLERFQTSGWEKGLFFYGGTGVGKTTITKALAFDVRYRTGLIYPEGWREPAVEWGQKARVQWWDVQDLFYQMGQQMDGKEHTYDPYLIEHCELLVLDDFGKELPSDWKRSELFRLINNRCNHGKCLVITSNWSREELNKRFLDLAPESEPDIRALADRLNELCTSVLIPGKSRRKS